jgi:dimethylargininase
MTYPWGRKLAASALSAFLIAVIVHVGNIVGLTLGYITSGSVGWTSFTQLSDFFALASVFAFVLLFVAGIIGSFRSWWTALIAGFVVGVIAKTANALVAVLAAGSGTTAQIGNYLWHAIGGQDLFFIALVTVLTPTFARWLYHRFAQYEGRGNSGRRLAFVRVPATNLADGIVTHIERTPVDQAKADAQWDGYVAALSAAGWQTVEVAATETLPDSVFVEDAAVVLGNTAVITNPGAQQRRAELPTVEDALRAEGLRLQRIVEPGTLDGGDVLQVGDVVYVGRGGRTNAEGVRQLRAIAGPLGYTVVAVPMTRALHLKSAATALPDGTVIGHPSVVDAPSVFERYLEVPEPEGAHVVILDDETVLMSASAPRSAALIGELGYRVVTVDISEFEKVEGCVTCLSILVR